METKSIKIFGRAVSASQASELLVLHHSAFSQSACRSCSGLCCKDCATSDGYLYKDEVSYQEISQLKRQYGFDSKQGFKSAHGCKLPLHKRSTTCAAFYCENISNENSFSREILRQRRNEVGTIPGLDVIGVSTRVEALHEKMREFFD